VPDLTLFRRIEVNGKDEHPLFTYLKGTCATTRDFYQDAAMLYYSPIRANDVRWNFEKFLVDRRGRPVYRYDISTPLETIQADIEHVLNSTQY